ncbi:MAG: hypothetical protein UHI81_03095 [Olegusella sp.]|nr:hypothetical protein [Olegusella sp.]
MSLREALYQVARTYCILVTLITVAILVLGETFDAGATFSYDVFLSPLVFALVGAVPELVMVSGEELSRRAYVGRKVVQFALIETGVLAVAFASPAIPSDRADVAVSLVATVAVVYVAACACTYLSDRHAARKMTDDLARFQAR